MSITYSENPGVEVKVYLNGRRIGTIKTAPNGWRYYPKGSKTSGEIFATVRAVKQSIPQQGCAFQIWSVPAGGYEVIEQ